MAMTYEELHSLQRGDLVRTSRTVGSIPGRIIPEGTTCRVTDPADDGMIAVRVSPLVTPKDFTVIDRTVHANGLEKI